MGIEFIDGGGYFEVNLLKGASDSLTMNLIFSYLGGDAPHYNVDQLDGQDASLLLSSSDGAGRMFVNQTDDFKVISSSVIMAAIANGGQLNYKPYLLSEIIDYFMEYNPVTGLISHIQSLQELQNYPNPFSNFTRINFNPGEAGNVHFAVYSATGELVKSWNVNAEKGNNQSIWDARNESGERVNPGVYILQFVTAEQQTSRRIIVIQ